MSARRNGERLNNKKNPLNPYEMSDRELLKDLLPSSAANKIADAIDDDVRNLIDQDVRNLSALPGVGSATQQKIAAFVVLASRLLKPVKSVE